MTAIDDQSMKDQVLWLRARVAAMSDIIMLAKLVTPQLLDEGTQIWKEVLEDDARKRAANEN